MCVCLWLLGSPRCLLRLMFFFKEYIYVCLSLLFLFVSIVLLAFCVLFRVLSIWLFYLICSCLALCHHLLDLALSFSRFFVFQTQRILVVVLCCFVVVVFACVVSGRPCSHCVLCLCFLLCFYGFLRLWTFNGIILRLLCSSWCYYDKIDLIGLFVCCFWYHESIDIIFEVLIISMD